MSIRKNKDSKKIYKSVLDVCGRGVFLLDTLKEVMKTCDLTYEEVINNSYFKEHISGKGWNGVPNQGTSSLDFGVIRGVTDRLGLRATASNWGAIFNSYNSLQIKKPKKFSDLLHCEHTISVKELRLLCLKRYFNGEIKTPSQLAIFLILNQIVCTILKDEQVNLRNDVYSYMPFKKYQFDIYYDNIKVNDIDIYEIQLIYKDDVLFGNILKALKDTTVKENNQAYKNGRDMLINKIVSYHRVPKNLEIFKLSKDELEKIYYTHKSRNIKYKKNGI